MKNLLIISTTGMGDTLWGTPAIRSIKKKFPLVGIDLLVNPQWKPLFKENKKPKPDQRARESLAHSLFSHNDFITVR